MSAALFSAGLGDVIRTCYQTSAYRVISEAQRPLPVVVASHNPFAIEIFRHHRNARNFILYDLGHKYLELHDAGLRTVALSRAICDFAGVDYDHIIRGKAEGYVPVFDAPDTLASQGHVVFQPFAGHGRHRTLPPEVMHSIITTLRRLPWQVFVVTRSFPSVDACGKLLHAEEDARHLAGGNITVLENLTVPASINLIKTCRAYVGSWSSLHQAAWLEHKPVAVFYPSTFHPEGGGYDLGLERANTFSRHFDCVDTAEIEAFLRRW